MRPGTRLDPTARPVGQVDLFAAMDYWRRPGQAMPTTGFKEWSHFSIMGGDVDLLINFSLMDEPGSTTARRREVGRLTVAYRDPRGVWEGDVGRYDEDAITVARGEPAIALGASAARITDGVYRLTVDLPSAGVQGALTLVPLARPIFANQVRLSQSEHIRWLVVPRLEASGELDLGGRRVRFERAPAYHDRNWGSFTWGGGSAWEWATILPAEPAVPWSLVYSRISDAVRAEVRSQSLILWRGPLPHRKFFGRDLTVQSDDVLRCARPTQIPKFVALLGAGIGADLPRRMLVTARAYQDELRLAISLADFAQIGVPNDRRPGVSKLSEARGAAEVSGRVGGQAVRFTGRVHAEFNQPGA